MFAPENRSDGEYFHLIRTTRLPRDPIFAPEEHARAQSILSQPQKPGRQAGYVSVEDFQTVPVSEIERNLLVVGLDAKRSGLAADPF